MIIIKKYSMKSKVQYEIKVKLIIINFLTVFKLFTIRLPLVIKMNLDA